MEKIILENCHPSTGSVYMDTLPDQIFGEVKKFVDSFKNKFKLASKLGSANTILAGQLQNQLIVTSLPESLKCYIGNFLSENITQNSLQFYEQWLNFQEKTEYNPSHSHRGDWSYVIWVEMPYELNNEDLLPNSVNANMKTNGRFQFTYIDNYLHTQIHTIDTDKEFEGKILIFQSALRHCVYPFYTSDKPRISLAGNIIINE